MPVSMQDVFVTLAAIAAASIIARRVFTTVRPAGGAPSKCASCPAAQHHARPDFAESQVARLRDSGASNLTIRESANPR